MPDDYAYCTTLTRDQWAWEFLRRNPDYQTDYRRFIAQWRALEADYGVPPQRDFQRWKRDPRAYGPLPGDVELAAPGGLKAENEEGTAFDSIDRGGKRTIFDANWRKDQKISDAQYAKLFADADALYSRLLQALITQAKRQ